ncbi:MAG: hypothetical protein KDI46_09985 [Alphaproteobacteria bacterium]|nr:hypothetical protein [Alphaproteobacteria bacterium]
MASPRDSYTAAVSAQRQSGTRNALYPRLRGSSVDTPARLHNPPTPCQQEPLYPPPADEAAFVASDEDFSGNGKLNDTLKFVGWQLAAAGLLTVHGATHGDPGSTVTGSLNFARNLLWLGAHVLMAKPHRIPRLIEAFERVGGHVYNGAGALAFYSAPKAFLQAKATSIFDRAAQRRERLTAKLSSQMYREIWHCRINYIGSGGGVLVHAPQAFMSDDPLLVTGAYAAAAGYALYAIDQYRETSVWQSLYQRVKNKSTTFDHRESHIVAGYFAKGQILQDAAFKWAAPLLLTGKGLLYGFEGVMLQNPALFASGAAFAWSGGHEFMAQNGSKVRYGLQKTSVVFPSLKRFVPDCDEHLLQHVSDRPHKVNGHDADDERFIAAARLTLPDAFVRGTAHRKGGPFLICDPRDVMPQQIWEPEPKPPPAPIAA